MRLAVLLLASLAAPVAASDYVVTNTVPTTYTVTNSPACDGCKCPANKTCACSPSCPCGVAAPKAAPRAADLVGGAYLTPWPDYARVIAAGAYNRTDNAPLVERAVRICRVQDMDGDTWRMDTVVDLDRLWLDGVRFVPPFGTDAAVDAVLEWCAGRRINAFPGRGGWEFKTMPATDVAALLAAEAEAIRVFSGGTAGVRSSGPKATPVKAVCRGCGGGCKSCGPDCPCGVAAPGRPGGVSYDFPDTYFGFAKNPNPKVTQKGVPTTYTVVNNCSCNGCKCSAGKACVCVPNCACIDCPDYAFKATAKTKPAFAVRVDAVGEGGSGTVVFSGDGKSVIVTNRHLASGPGTYTVTLNDGRVLKATFLAAAGTVESGADIAALLVDTELPACKLADGDPDVGTEVVFWGRSTPFSRGKVVGMFNYVSAPAIAGQWNSDSGDSGSGLFDLRGRMVGIHKGRMLAPDQTRHAARLSDLRAFLFSLRPKVAGLAVITPVTAKLLPEPGASVATTTTIPAIETPAPARAAAPACQLIPVTDRFGRVVGYRQVCPNSTVPR